MIRIHSARENYRVNEVILTSVVTAAQVALVRHHKCKTLGLSGGRVIWSRDYGSRVKVIWTLVGGNPKHLKEWINMIVAGALHDIEME